MKRLNFILGLLVILAGMRAIAGESAAATFSGERFTINFKGTDLRDALMLIASKGHLQLSVSGELGGKVNYAIRNSTLEDALDTIASTNGLVYQVNGKNLMVTKKKKDEAGSMASAGSSTRQPASEAFGMDGGLTYRSVPVMYANAHDVVGNLQKNLLAGESIVADEANNVLLLFSSLNTYEQIKTFIALYDRKPAQILIEAQIVETTKSFAQNLGVSWGDMSAETNTPSTGGIINPGAPNPNLILRGLIGSIDGHLLEARLLAGESNGEAKIVSRPKVFALNNKKATIHSGITYNIKTLSAVTTGASSPTGSTTTPTAVTGGIVAITSGLELDVTPTVVGEGLVRLVVRVTNSEPDTGSSVDGIPGINDNSAETSILVRGGQTASMAGLLKNTKSKSESGVPWISHIPILGWLFSSTQKSEATSELMIFLTPHIIDVTSPPPSVQGPAVASVPAAAPAPVVAAVAAPVQGASAVPIAAVPSAAPAAPSVVAAPAK